MLATRSRLRLATGHLCGRAGGCTPTRS